MNDWQWWLFAVLWWFVACPGVVILSGFVIVKYTKRREKRNEAKRHNKND